MASVAYCQGLWRYREKTTTRRQSETAPPVLVHTKNRRGLTSRPTALRPLKMNIGLSKSTIVDLSPKEFWTTVVDRSSIQSDIVVSISGDIVRDHIRDQGEMTLPL
jgi:hypothetical protein